MRATDIADLLPYMTDDERAEVGKLLSTDKALWRPQPGPQTDAYFSEADITGYGGAAGGGKTDLMCGTMLTQHERGIIFRREATQLVGIIDRLAELLGSRHGYNGQDKIWRIPGKQVEFGSFPHAGDEAKYQGRPHDFIGFDEATNLLESQVRFLLGWLRTTTPGQRCRALLTFNPPTTSDGRWVIDFFGPWLNAQHPNPAKPGELRWFATIAGADVEVEDGREFVIADGEPRYEFDRKRYRREEIIKPLSRTFIPSRVTDNPFLTGTGYIAQLQGLPEPLRSQMLRGDFMAGVEDDRWQVIPTAWVEAAQARWTPKDAKGPMDSLGVDVSRGGRDETIISPRHGAWYDELTVMPGTASPDGPTVGGQVLMKRRDKAPVHIDIVGWGSSPYDWLVGQEIQTIGVNGAEGTDERTKDDTLGFYNVRARDWWRLREDLDPENPDPIALPPDPKLKADLCAPRWRPTPRGILIESKEEILKRLRRSPDRGDAVVLARRMTAKRALERRVRPQRSGSTWMGA
ncbi:terminase family protein [Caulobacter sp. FWC2]|uniref:terminase family protein n=1 Tax=Caulobacter sp. FWC2 TaxID=69664 RepID=UPI0013045E89|nr:terminase family protein [Caulobacter sp. FWC2]